MLSGFLLINKPTGWTSHDVVGYLRPITGIKKIGHAGTLDPFATGLLIVGIGREATRNLDKFKSMPKTYEARLKLGQCSNTFDPTGEITAISKDKYDVPDIKKIQATLKQFTGKQKQIPPMYSAKKINGQKLCNLARQGKEVERKPQDISIYDIKLISFDWPELIMEISCSPGTYIRSLANDIGQKLNCGAYCSQLKRTKIGDYSIENSVDLKDINKDNYPQLLLNL